VAVDGAGNVYIVDTQNQRVRKVNTAGIISTLAGNGTLGFSGDGNPATSAMLNMPDRVAVDGSGNVYFSVAGRIRKVNGAGTISTVAGMGTAGFVGDGGPATSAGLSLGGLGIAVDGAGNLYIADTAFQRVRKVDTSGIIRTIAGTGAAGYSGDGGPATSATFNDPQALAVDNAGNLYIVDNRNNCVRKVNPSGIISTVAGTGTAGYSGDGGPASRAQLSDPSGVSVDGAGNLYIADRINRRIRKVDPASGIITTVAGTGTAGASPDGGAAITTNLPVAADVAADSSGNLYIVDSQRIRKVTAGGGGGPGGGTGPIPSITAIVDAAAYTANIAEGSVFVVKGKNLCDSGTVFGSVPYSSAPLNGVKITFTPVNGGAGTDAYMVYTYAAGATTQLAAILPSTVPARDYNVTVTNNGSVSAVFKATVVVHKFGIISVNGSGAGRAELEPETRHRQVDHHESRLLPGIGAGQ
jgi:sugar lactone lactonase YvrE